MPHCAICGVSLLHCQWRSVNVAYPLECLLLAMWVCNINTVPLTREETYTAYRTIWRPSFKFLLLVTSFTKKQCNILQRIFTGPFLAKMGISHTTSRVLIFAPYQYSGFALADTWVQQGLQHLRFLLGHLSY